MVRGSSQNCGLPEESVILYCFATEFFTEDCNPYGIHQRFANSGRHVSEIRIHQFYLHLFDLCFEMVVRVVFRESYKSRCINEDCTKLVITD